MKRAKILIVIILAVSLLSLIWINTGKHEEYGYTSCGGGGIFYSADSIDPNNPGGPCYGTPLYKSFTGRYENRFFMDVVLGVITCLSGTAYILLKPNKSMA